MVPRAPIVSQARCSAFRLHARCVATGRLPHVATERGAEGTRGAVTDAFGDLGDSEIAAMEEILRHSHAPGKQILHRWQAYCAREALEERRARERGRPCQLSHG